MCTRDFPGGPAVKVLFSLQGAQVRSLVRKLRSHIPCGVAKKRKKVIHIPIYPFKVHNSIVVFFFKYIHRIVQPSSQSISEHFHLSKRNLLPISDHFPFTTSFQSFATTNLLSVSIDTCCSFGLPSFT